MVIPVAFKYIGLSEAADLLLRLGRWPAMFVVLMLLWPSSTVTGRAARRRGGGGSPDRASGRHPVALDLGAVFLVGVQFGKFNETYGSLGGLSASCSGFPRSSSCWAAPNSTPRGASDRARYHDRLPEANGATRTRLKRPRAGDAGPMASKIRFLCRPFPLRRVSGTDNLGLSLCCGRPGYQLGV